ncbi:hypothetical protein [Actinoplanes couchii]|uniref:hypothetical protein n=1 Tax=Actinoplanes couchii TaxID=403638 RepID=UPI001EF18108|nr:hypothetical protein [Actinoplanes couchii]MDR6322461.1 hypothetical protein [Actinoplanes couchii]
MRFERALCALVLVGLVGGCTSDPAEPAPATSGPPPSAPAWTEPAAYTFTLVRGCDDTAPEGRYQATVKDGVVTTATRAGGAASPAPSSEADLGPVTGEEGEEIDVPALGQLLEMAETAKDDGAEVATEYDLTDGHPVKVTINVMEEVDGLECWTVTDYQP